jgi:hypothetical protein
MLCQRAPFICGLKNNSRESFRVLYGGLPFLKVDVTPWQRTNDPRVTGCKRGISPKRRIPHQQRCGICVLSSDGQYGIPFHIALIEISCLYCYLAFEYPSEYIQPSVTQMPQSTIISRPKCGHEFDVEEVLARQIEEKMRNEFDLKASALRAEYEKQEQL